MAYFLEILELVTEVHTSFYNITEVVLKAIERSKVREGQVLIQTKHTTTGIFVNEAEPLLYGDVISHLNHFAPQIKGKYRHDDITKRKCPDNEPENAHAHIKAQLYSQPSIQLALHQGKLMLGKWQSIIFAEFDGPCPRKGKSKREIVISILGERREDSHEGERL